jgi:hypothetical protein
LSIGRAEGPFGVIEFLIAVNRPSRNSGDADFITIQALDLLGAEPPNFVTRVHAAVSSLALLM